jgi:SPX domain protein involved in polyphosphate accumulation
VESPNVIERYEFKYLIPERLVPAIREAARATSRIDEHAGPDGTYRIRSLYLDTDRYHLYWANEREAGDRFKARIRGYPGSEKAPVFFEVKRRVYDVILKTRAALPVDRWKDVLEGRADPSIALGGAAGKRGTEKFIQKMATYHLRPVILVEYEREAYASVVDKYARLTFDRKVACQPKETLDLEADPKRWRPVDNPTRTVTLEPVCVLELKFETKPPRWMVNLVKRLDLTRRSFSKYCYSVDAQLLLPQAQRVIGVRGIAS